MHIILTLLCSKYYRKHDSSLHLITTHPRIPTLIEIIPLPSVYSAPSRYIFPTKRLITGEAYPNPGHREGSVRTKPSPVCQHLGSVRSQSKFFLDGTGLDWTVPVWTDPLLDWWNHWSDDNLGSTWKQGDNTHTTSIPRKVDDASSANPTNQPNRKQTG